MAYTPDTLSMVINTVGGSNRRLFYYDHTAESDATIVGAGYFSDGVTKGMRVGDIVDAFAATGPKYKRYQVASVSGATATVAAPTAIT